MWHDGAAACAGESNLKIRRPLDLKAGVIGSAAEAHALVGVLRCEPPNPNLHYFAGRFTYRLHDGERTRSFATRTGRPLPDVPRT